MAENSSRRKIRRKRSSKISKRTRIKRLLQDVALLVAVLFCLGWGCWSVWKSDYIQMRYVYMWNYQQDIITYSQKNKIDPFLVAAIIKNESNFDNKAVSPVGAIGLMQIMPDTGAWIAQQMGLANFKEDSLYQAEMNIRMGCWYVGELEYEFKDNLTLVMIAYNAGRGQTKLWMEENGWNYDFNDPAQIPYPDTREYVQRVLKDRDNYYLYYRDTVNKQGKK